MKNGHFILLLFSIFIASSLPAQSLRKYDHNINGWYMYFGSHQVSEKWGLHLEAQYRRHDIILKNQQLLLRTGINYHFNSQAFLTLGYCFVETYPYGDFASKAAFPENRFWEQLQLKNTIGKVEMVTRFRLEQRLINVPVLKTNEYVPGNAIYSNRMRLLSRFSIPFKGQAIEDKSFYLSAYDELFIAFGENVAFNIFDQNRAYIALGYKIPGVGRMEIAYLNQLIFKSDGIKIENNHTLQMGITVSTTFRKKKDK